MEVWRPSQYSCTIAAPSSQTWPDLVLGILILADMLFLLSRSGVAVEGGLLNRIMKVREWSTILGVAIVVLLLSKLGVVACL